MIKLINIFTRMVLSISLGLVLLGINAYGSSVNFTMSLDKDTDGGQTYNNFYQAGAGLGNAYTVGFQIQLNSVNGVALTNSGPIAAFCAELEESISPTSTYTFETAPLANLSAGRAGESQTASSCIPVGGIGKQRAAYVQYLFDSYYVSSSLDEWTSYTDKSTTQAFQLALWEITHDTGLDIYNGDIYMGEQTSGATAYKNNSISLAEEMLLSINSAGIDESYTSSKFDFWALVDEGADGSTGSQDVILATKKLTGLDEVLNEAIPEPTTQALICLFGGSILFLKRLIR